MYAQAQPGGSVAFVADRIQQLRTDYESTPLALSDTASDPVEQFDRWFSEAIAAEVDEPNAMVLSTVSADGAPSSRAVLLKSFGRDGFVFYTNRSSRKGIEIAANPKVSLLFLWLPLHRQVRVEGTTHAVDDSESDEYFSSRPVDARISAAASPQSSVIESRKWLEDRVASLRASSDRPPARPPAWGGLRVDPSAFEFWQGRPSRLHDRIRYEPTRQGWTRVRLAP
jgi:pyridoxamine 5'-phosphate oxidase